MHHGKIISFISTKGSVGKTSLTIHMAGYLADLGKKVLLIDADSQQSLSSFFDLSILDERGQSGFALFLMGKEPAESVISSTLNHENNDIIVNDDPDKFLVSNFLRHSSSVIQHGALFGNVGLDEETLETLSTLTVKEMQALAQHNWAVYQIDRQQLLTSIHKITRSRHKDRLINQAIQLGASRKMMRHLVKLSFHEFRHRRQALALFDSPKRPTVLGETDLEQLIALHADYRRSHVMHGKTEHLLALIYLSHQSGININRIYQYYYREYLAFFEA